MDIKSQLALNRPLENLLNLQVGQKLDAKVISATIMAEKSTVILKLANNLLTLQSGQPVELTAGQALKIQVTERAPALQFKILSPLPELKLQSVVLSLKPGQPATEKPDAAQGPAEAEHPLALKQQFGAKIIGLVGNKIQLQIVPAEQNQSNPGNKQAVVLTIERSQLQLSETATTAITPAAGTSKPPQLFGSALKIGQFLNLEVVKTGARPQFKPVLARAVPEEKITEWVRQLLPRHEASPVLLNQLIKDLPTLLNNANISQVLKQLAESILQTLPRQQQLINQQGLKDAINHSGLFLEAKLQQSEGKPEATFEHDFKAGLLNFVQALKQEIAKQGPGELNDTGLGMLKNLERKSENTIARMVLDQLVSLPKDESPKQVWTLDIPFMGKEKTDAIKIEIQRDKENNGQSDDSNWSVNITITPPGLGTIYCTVSCLDQVVNSYFLSRKAQTTDLINRHLDYFKEQLEQAGLTAGRIAAQNGRAKTQSLPEIAGKPLFDDQA